MSSALQNQLLFLEDIITPQDVSFWPLALGWWVLLLVCILAIAASIIFYRRYKKKWDYRREALALLEAYKKDLNNNDIAIKYLECLKRVAITAYPNKDIDSLYGKEWLTFLNQQTPTPLFKDDIATFVCTAQYKKTFKLENNDLYNAVKIWIKSHSTTYAANHQSTKGDSI